MIIKSLVDYYERLAAQGKVPAFGMTQEKIGYSILLDRNGKIQDVVGLSDPLDKKSKWKLLTVPASFKRSGIAPPPFFLWDKMAFVLGVEQKGKSETPTINSRANGVFKALHRDRLADATDEGLVALRRFIETWDPEQWQQCEHIVKHLPAILGANLVFRLDGENEYIHDRPVARELAKQYSETGDTELSVCLVSGKKSPIARLHPAIKGVWGSQTSGASLVSFNLDAFDSYGKERGHNAPVSVYAAFAYTTVLNYLLLRDEHHLQCVQIGDASVVFWAEAKDQQHQEAAENVVRSAFDSKYNEAVANANAKHVLDTVAEARGTENLNAVLDSDSRIFVLGLSPNASRLSVRFWFTERLEVFKKRLAEHYNDLLIEPLPWKTQPTPWQLLLSIAARDKAENISPRLLRSLTLAIISGRQYPSSLLPSTIASMRADGKISGKRVALCKAALSRKYRLNKKTHLSGVPMCSDENCTEPGYVLGRLFAVMYEIQMVALGEVNSSIKDRYYASASVAPQRIFKRLTDGVQNHISRGKKGPRRKKIEELELKMKEILRLIGGKYPKSLSIEQQGMFSLGYYFEYEPLSKSRTNKTEADEVDNETTEAAQ